MNPQTIPEFAIIGHPNEGKSSVLSTLAEDDSVRVSPIPGETVLCQPFPVRIDGREIIRFIDTPGFQNPRQTLQWLQEYQGPEDRLLTAFIEAHRDDPAFRDDCELLRPVAGDDRYFVVTHWADEESFQGWVSSRSFADGHGGRPADESGRGRGLAPDDRPGMADGG